MQEPPTFWETLLRRLSRFGDVGPLRRALERWGLVKRNEPPRYESILAHQIAWEHERHRVDAQRMHEFQVEAHTAMQRAYDEWNAKQDPAVWDAADRARRESGE